MSLQDGQNIRETVYNEVPDDAGPIDPEEDVIQRRIHELIDQAFGQGVAGQFTEKLPSGRDVNYNVQIIPADQLAQQQQGQFQQQQFPAGQFQQQQQQIPPQQFQQQQQQIPPQQFQQQQQIPPQQFQQQQQIPPQQFQQQQIPPQQFQQQQF